MQLFSQNEESIPDVSAENWLAGSFTYSTKNNLKISLQEQIRMVYGSNPFDRILSELQIVYKKKKKWIFSSLRLIIWSNGWGLRHYLKRDRRENIDSLSPFFFVIIYLAKLAFKFKDGLFIKEYNIKEDENMFQKMNEIGDNLNKGIGGLKLD